MGSRQLIRKNRGRERRVRARGRRGGRRTGRRGVLLMRGAVGLLLSQQRERSSLLSRLVSLILL